MLTHLSSYMSTNYKVEVEELDVEEQQGKSLPFSLSLPCTSYVRVVKHGVVGILVVSLIEIFRV